MAQRRERQVSLRKRVHVAVVVVAALAAAIGVRGQGGSPDPILVVLNDSAPNPFGAYLPERETVELYERILAAQNV